MPKNSSCAHNFSSCKDRCSSGFASVSWFGMEHSERFNNVCFLPTDFSGRQTFIIQELKHGYVTISAKISISRQRCREARTLFRSVHHCAGDGRKIARLYICLLLNSCTIIVSPPNFQCFKGYVQANSLKCYAFVQYIRWVKLGRRQRSQFVLLWSAPPPSRYACSVVFYPFLLTSFKPLCCCICQSHCCSSRPHRNYFIFKQTIQFPSIQITADNIVNIEKCGCFSPKHAIN